MLTRIPSRVFFFRKTLYRIPTVLSKIFGIYLIRYDDDFYVLFCIYFDLEEFKKCKPGSFREMYVYILYDYIRYIIL